MDTDKLSKHIEVYNMIRDDIETKKVILCSLEDKILSMVKSIDTSKIVDEIKFIRGINIVNGKSNAACIDLAIDYINEIKSIFISDKIMRPTSINFDVIRNKSEKVIQYDLCIKTTVNTFRVLVPVIDNIGVNDLISTKYGAYIAMALDSSYKIIDQISSYDTRNIQNFIYRNIS